MTSAALAKWLTTAEAAFACQEQDVSGASKTKGESKAARINSVKINTLQKFC